MNETAKLKEEQQGGPGNNNTGNGGNGNNVNNPSVFEDQNPFVAAREAQRMVGAYPEDDVARASLEQLNEISRRATAAGMTFLNGNGTNNGSSGISGQNGRPVTPASASRILAAAAGMLQGQTPGGQQQQQQQQQTSAPNGLPLNLTREDALQRIEELARQRPASQQGMRLPGPSNVGPSGGNGMGGMGGSSGMNGNGGTGSAGNNGGQQVLPSMQYTASGEAFMMSNADSGSLDVVYGGIGGIGGGGGGQGGLPPATSITHSGLQVFTLGHLMPKSTGDDDSAIWSFDPVRMQQQQQGGGSSAAANAQAYADAAAAQAASASISEADYDVDSGGAGSSSGANAGSSGSGGPVSRPGSAQKLRVRRSTFVPGWAVPPRVLLVDDDAVSRKLSSKFLQVFGCTIDVAVDGVVAVNKMNLEKYDLVLMVCNLISYLFYVLVLKLGWCRIS